MYVCIYIYIYVYVYMYICICMYKYIYICICVYIYIYIIAMNHTYPKLWYIDQIPYRYLQYLCLSMSNIKCLALTIDLLISENGWKWYVCET